MGLSSNRHDTRTKFPCTVASSLQYKNVLKLKRFFAFLYTFYGKVLLFFCKMLAFFLMIFHNSEINGEKMSKTLKEGKQTWL